MIPKGKHELRKYEAGKKLNPTEAIRAKCYDCMVGYADGMVDCMTPECSLYPFMPYLDSGNDETELPKTAKKLK